MVLRIGLGLLAFVLMAAPASAKRMALVIGNSDYVHTARLANPANDAADMAAALRQLGFTVVEGRDLDKASMDAQLHAFARQLEDTKIAVFYYAGHGLQVDGRNYLVPTDATLSTASALDFETVRLDLVQRTIERATDTSVIFLDACRDNPLARNLARSMGTRSSSIGRGLAAVESGVGTLVSFSTQPGNVALDGSGRNSPFAKALIQRIGTPGEDISSILIGVRNDVMAETGNRQVPWEHTALRARLFFQPPGAAVETASADPAARGAPPPGPYDGLWKVAIKGGRYCPIKSHAYNIRITQGVVYAGYDMRGHVNDAGDITYKVPSRVNPSITVRFTGKLADGKGRGGYIAIGKKCTGTAVYTRQAEAPTPKTQ